MKIKNITNPKRFFEMVGKCKGRVELLTSEGDQLNLKSKLCQYIMLTQMFKDASVGEIEIVVSEPEDIHLLEEYLVRV
jgi:hypothetical protein